MVKNFILSCLCVFILLISSITYSETEVALVDDTENSGFTIKSPSLNDIFSARGNGNGNGNGNVGIGTTNPEQKLSVSGTIESTSGGYKFPDGTIQTTASTGGGNSVTIGPKFITPVTIFSGASTVTFTTYDASINVPAGATTVILEAEAAMSGPDSGDVDAHIRIRRNSSSPNYVLLRCRSASSGDNIALSSQGIFPITTDRKFDYTVESPGFGRTCTIRLIGYY